MKEGQQQQIFLPEIEKEVFTIVHHFLYTGDLGDWITGLPDAYSEAKLILFSKVYEAADILGIPALKLPAVQELKETFSELSEYVRKGAQVSDWLSAELVMTCLSQLYRHGFRSRNDAPSLIKTCQSYSYR